MPAGGDHLAETWVRSSIHVDGHGRNTSGRRAVREAMTELAASTYAISEDMPAGRGNARMDRHRERMWRSLTDPAAAESQQGSDAGHRTHFNDGCGTDDHGLNRNPESSRLVWRAVENARAPLRVTLGTIQYRRAEAVARAAWHRSHGAPAHRGTTRLDMARRRRATQHYADPSPNFGACPPDPGPVQSTRSPTLTGPKPPTRPSDPQPV